MSVDTLKYVLMQLRLVTKTLERYPLLASKSDRQVLAQVLQRLENKLKGAE